MSGYLIARDAGVATVTLDRPQRLNAWTSAMRDALADELIALDADRQVRAVVMTGAGERAFCAGQDLAETQAFAGAEHVEDWLTRLRRFYDAIRGLGKPLVGAINGVAAGSGFQAVMMMDVVVAHPEVRMGQVEINSGIPSAFGTWMLLERVGRARAAELVLEGRLMDAAECRALGLVHHLVEREAVRERAQAVARSLAAKPPLAMRITKRALRDANQPQYEAAFRAAAGYQIEAFVDGEPQRVMAEFFAERARRKGGG